MLITNMRLYTPHILQHYVPNRTKLFYLKTGIFQTVYYNVIHQYSHKCAPITLYKYHYGRITGNYVIWPDNTRDLILQDTFGSQRNDSIIAPCILCTVFFGLLCLTVTLVGTSLIVYLLFWKK